VTIVVFFSVTVDVTVTEYSAHFVMMSIVMDILINQVNTAVDKRIMSIVRLIRCFFEQ